MTASLREAPAAAGPAPAPPPAAEHHPSHTDLLHRAEAPPVLGKVDAIIVPTGRPAAYLRDALRLARRLDCPLVALCSLWAGAPKARSEAVAAAAHLIAVDLDGPVRLPTFATSTKVHGSRFARRTDTSLKRNIGLAVAHMAGWQRVVFIDDDITDLVPDDVRAAATLLADFDMVALENSGFPDNSVVCHAMRKVGMYQDSFVGGGAMAVPVDHSTSFFPNIYNEDWLFLVGAERPSRVAVTGKVSQKAFDPYDKPERARGQEFGDCIAEGLYTLLDDRRPIRDANVEFWQGFLDNRRKLIGQVLARVPDLELTEAERGRMNAAIKAAQGRRSLITPQLCVDYVTAWRADQEIWASYFAALPQGLSARKALAHLGLTSTQIALPR